MPFDMNDMQFEQSQFEQLFNSAEITVPELIDTVKKVCKGALDKGRSPFEVKGALMTVLDLAMFYAEMDRDFE